MWRCSYTAQLYIIEYSYCITISDTWQNNIIYRSANTNTFHSVIELTALTLSCTGIVIMSFLTILINQGFDVYACAEEYTSSSLSINILMRLRSLFTVHIPQNQMLRDYKLITWTQVGHSTVLPIQFAWVVKPSPPSLTIGNGQICQLLWGEPFNFHLRTYSKAAMTIKPGQWGSFL